MNAEQLLDRLDKVKQVAPGRWVSRCPAHSDKSPSLSIRETDDGRILLHDFAGCGVDDVLAAIGMSIRDLFPERLTDYARSQKPNHWHARKEAFETLHKEALVIALAGETLGAGTPLSLQDRDRLCLAAQRVRAAVEVCR